VVHERAPFDGCPSRYEASSEILPPQGNKESFADELLDNAVVIELFNASGAAENEKHYAQDRRRSGKKNKFPHSCQQKISL
jgi:hypothetical protein